jgi:hypothetical protein
MYHRARLFALFVAVSVVVLALGVTHYSSASSFALIARGSFSGVAWRLTGSSSRDWTYCLNMKIPASSKSGGSGACGSIYVPGRYGPDGITYAAAHAGRPLPGWVVGPVVATARIVVIKLSNGDTLRVKTIAPPAALFAGIRFYVAELPCPGTPSRFTARDGSGRVVAHLDLRPHIGFAGKVTC